MIASKYRRAYEIKPCLCPEAITMEPVYSGSQTYLNLRCYETYYVSPDNLIYILVKYDTTNEIYILDKNKETLEFPINISAIIKEQFKLKLIYQRTNMLICYISPGVPMHNLVSAMILMKRNHIPISGNTTVHVYQTQNGHKNYAHFTLTSTVRKILYEIPSSVWNPECLMEKFKRIFWAII
jgi:hypothetical protein